MTVSISALASAIALTAAAARGATVSSTTQQLVRGIGASGAWWVNDLAFFPDDVRQNVSTLLFDPDAGLWITDYRYNLGGGGLGVNNPSRAPETPYVSDGVYNFSADAAGTFYLKEAARRQIPQITLFVNSAPSTFTTNGQSCGGFLIDTRIPAYAQYLADVVGYWATQGVNITHVSPMNEPDNSFSDCGQEGMAVDPFTRGILLQAVASALSAANLTAKVIGDETSQTWEFLPEAPLWLNPAVGAAIDGIAHHQYAFVDGNLQKVMTDEARSLSGGTPTWSTEICCYKELLDSDAENPLSVVVFGSKYDPTMVGALRMALLIFQALGTAQDEHWDWWTALSSGIGSCTPSTNATCLGQVNYDGWEDGIIYYDPNYADTGYFDVYPTKRFSVLKHFTAAAPFESTARAVSTGLIGSESSWRALAFDRAGAPHALVAMNARNATGSITFSGADGFALPAPKGAVRTNEGEDYVTVDAPAVAEDGSVSIVDAPALSIYTIFF